MVQTKEEKEEYYAITVLNPVKKFIKNLVALDIENDPVSGNFKCAHLYGTYSTFVVRQPKKGNKRVSHREEEQHTIDEAFLSQDEFKERLLYFGKENRNKLNKCVLCCFNASYDTQFFKSIIDEKTVLRAGSQFITGNTLNGVRILDLARHVPHTSLEEWMEALDLQRYGIVKTLNPQHMAIEELQEHNRADTMATWHLGEFIRDFYKEQGINFTHTIASAAMKIFRTSYLTNNFMIKKSIAPHDYSRQSYYGGRCEVFMRGDFDVFSFDVNSMYPYVMSNHVYPNPTTAKFVPSKHHFYSTYNNELYLTIAKCKVYVPDMKIAPLPIRTNDRLVFPTGTFTGVWTEPELKMAEKYGVKILDVYWYVRYAQADFYLRDYSMAMYNYRNDHPKGSPKNRMFKLLGNSLYGKFGEKNPKYNFIGDPLNCPFDLEEEDVRLIAYDNGNIHAYSHEQINSSHTFPELVAFITAYARIHLYERMKLHEESMVYCDTDSVKYLSTDFKDKDEKQLGGFKFEYQEKFKFIAPKIYVSLKDISASPLILSDKLGTLVPYSSSVRGISLPDDSLTKIKGIGRINVLIGLDVDKNIIYAEYDRPLSLLQIEKGNFNYGVWKKQGRILSGDDVKRTWFKDGTSKPIHLKDWISEENSGGVHHFPL